MNNTGENIHIFIKNKKYYESISILYFKIK